MVVPQVVATCVIVLLVSSGHWFPTVYHLAGIFAEMPVDAMLFKKVDEIIDLFLLFQWEFGVFLGKQLAPVNYERQLHDPCVKVGIT